MARHRVAYTLEEAEELALERRGERSSVAAGTRGAAGLRAKALVAAAIA